MMGAVALQEMIYIIQLLTLKQEQQILVEAGAGWQLTSATDGSRL